MSYAYHHLRSTIEASKSVRHTEIGCREGDLQACWQHARMCRSRGSVAPDCLDSQCFVVPALLTIDSTTRHILRRFLVPCATEPGGNLVTENRSGARFRVARKMWGATLLALPERRASTM